MLGWDSDATARASRSKRGSASPSSEKLSGRTLTATSRPSRVSRARYTSPIPPAPRRESSSYGPKRFPGAIFFISRRDHTLARPDVRPSAAAFVPGFTPPGPVLVALVRLPRTADNARQILRSGEARMHHHRPRSLRIVGLAAALACAASPAAAQAPPSASVKETAGATVIEIPVTVVGRDGRPVTGLAAADFELFDDGKKQAISALDVIDLSRPAPPAAAAES